MEIVSSGFGACKSDAHCKAIKNEQLIIMCLVADHLDVPLLTNGGLSGEYFFILL